MSARDSFAYAWNKHSIEVYSWFVAVITLWATYDGEELSRAGATLIFFSVGLPPFTLVRIFLSFREHAAIEKSQKDHRESEK